MSIEDEIKRLGGIEPALGDEYWPLTPHDIATATEAYGRPMPDEYLKFIMKYGCSLFTNLVHFKFPKKVPVYEHDPSLGLPSAPGSGGAAICDFYGGQEGNRAYTGLAAKIEVYTGRMPDGFVPIADDGLANKICLGYSPDGIPGIYFWDHENEWDEEVYLEDTGHAMPQAAKYQNVYFIAGSFEDLFKILQVTEFNT